MATITSPDELARRMEQFRQDRLQALQAEVGRIAEQSRDEAVRLTSGPRRAQNERGPVPITSRVGVRSGELRGGWRLVPFTRGSDERGWRLFNVAPHHVYALRNRGFWTSLRRFTLSEFQRMGIRVSVRTLT